MELAEIQSRHAAMRALHEDQRARFEALYALVHREFERHGVNRIADLPEEWQRVIDEAGWDLKTPGELSAEVAALDREMRSYETVHELRRIYGLPDTRTG